MQEIIDLEKLTTYNNLLKGRTDVFAVRWEKVDGTKSGYTPVCTNEWKNGLCNKLNRGKCKDCDHKQFAEWNNFYLQKHLHGHKTYGIYPLLPDNHSYFLAVDFDGKNWSREAKRFISTCQKHNLEAHLERSRSGDGAHVWFFFEDKFPALRSRNIFLNILREAKIIDNFSRDESFDRIFPSQDFVGDGEIGNMIVLPLQGQSKSAGSTLFLDYNSLQPIEDQWEYLTNIKKIQTSQLEAIFNKFNNSILKPGKTNKTIKIELSDQIYLKSNYLHGHLISFLKEKLNFFNPEYTIKKKMGIGVYNVEKFFNLIESMGNNIGIPRGFLTELINFLDEKGLKYTIVDERHKSKQIKFQSNLKLFDYQTTAMKNLLLSDNGVLIAPPGSGKTIMGIELIAKLKQPALILVHKKQIFDQWVERIESFLDIPKKNIGRICSNKKKIGEQVTVAMIQTLNKSEIISELKDKFGLVIVDECHHVPAKMFRSVITQFNPYYLYGLTATPDRKYKDERLIFLYIGDILHTISREDLLATTSTNEDQIRVIVKETALDLPFKTGMANFQTVSKILIHDSNRNGQIAQDIANEVNKGQKCLVLTERKEHAEILNLYLNSQFETVVLTGDLTDKQKREKIQQVDSGNFQIIIATGQLLGEGTDIQDLDCLFMVYPFSFHGKLIQYIGRLTRSHNNKSPKNIYDYRDTKIAYLDRLFKKREGYYKKNF